jgi:hypothetical protein
MCFILACWTRLLVSLIALSLSHSNGTFLNLIPKSFKVAFIQSICAQQLPAAMYSASTVDNATLFCFFDDHEISDLPNSWHMLDVLVLSTLHPVEISNYLKLCSFRIPQSNILCMLQVPQYSLCSLQVTFSWWGLKSYIYAHTRHDI